MDFKKVKVCQLAICGPKVLTIFLLMLMSEFKAALFFNLKEGLGGKWSSDQESAILNVPHEIQSLDIHSFDL